MASIRNIEIDRCYSLPRASKYAERIGTFRGYEILADRDDENFIDVHVSDDSGTLAHIVLEKKGKNVWSFHYTRINRKYCGFDLAPKIYSKLIKIYKDYTFVSGDSQSIGGKSIWNRLCKQKDIVVAVVNKNGEFHECSYSDNGIVECEVDPYRKKGYKMIAMRRK